MMELIGLLAGGILTLIGIFWRGLRQDVAMRENRKQTERISELEKRLEGEKEEHKKALDNQKAAHNAVIAHINSELNELRKSSLEIHSRHDSLEAKQAGTEAELTRFKGLYDTEKQARVDAETLAKSAKDNEQQALAMVDALRSELNTAKQTIEDLQKRVGSLEAEQAFIKGRESAFLEVFKAMKINAELANLPEKEKSDVKPTEQQ